MANDVVLAVQTAYAVVVYDGSPQSRQHIERVTTLSRDDVAALRPAAVSRPRRWSEEEERFVDEHLGESSIEEIARTLGRTPAAVEIRYTRRGMTAPSKRRATARDVGESMGVDSHAVARWIERGYLSARRVPGKRRIWQVRRVDLARFLANPANWACYRLEKIRDPVLRAFAERAQARHPELADYLTPVDAAKVAGISVGNLNLAIRQGRIPAKRWGNWWVLRRDAEAHRRRLSFGYDRWPTPGSDAFLVQAKEQHGMTYARIARAMKWPNHRQVGYRYRRLKQAGLLERGVA